MKFHLPENIVKEEPMKGEKEMNTTTQIPTISEMISIC
jgi:hypothetical protein